MASTAPAPASAPRASAPCASALRAPALRRAVTVLGVSPALIAALPLIMITTVVTAPHLLLLTDLTLIAVPHGDAEPGTAIASKIDTSDVIFLSIGMIALFRRLSRRTARRRRIPYFGLWMLYGVLTSLAYLYAPDNQSYLADSWRVPFQLYRHCWKTILYLPIVAALVDDRKKLRAVLTALVLCADVCAAFATFQSFSGGDPTGPFIHKNALGGFLIVPMILSLSGFLYPTSRWEKRFFAVSVVLLTRGLICSGSRGAVVATIGAVLCFGCGLLMTAHGRQRLLRLVVIGVCVLPIGLLLKPDVLERPNVQYLLEAIHPNEVGTYQWRKEERWPYFFQKMIDNPWLGVGTDSDSSLGESCVTPHNGYLSIGVTNGIPALVVVVIFALLTLCNSLRLFWRTADPTRQACGLMFVASTGGLLVHNWVDATLPTPDISRIFWLIAAAAAVTSRRPDFFRLPVRAAGTPRS